MLERFLADPVLFRTGADAADRRRRARANMAAELATLAAPAGSSRPSSAG